MPQTRRRLLIVSLRHDVVKQLGPFRLETAREWLKHRMQGGDTLLRRFPLTTIEAFEGKTVADLQDEYEQVMEAYFDLPTHMPGHHRAPQWIDHFRRRFSMDVERGYLTAMGLGNGNLSLFRDEFEAAMEEHEIILSRLGYLGRPVSSLSPTDGTNEVSVESAGVVERMWRIPPGENYEFVDGTEWQVAGKGLSLIYRRPFPLEPAPTVMAHGGGGTYAYHYDRGRSMLTNRERARLQSFTDDFQFVGNRAEIRSQIGEAVPPLLAVRIAEELLEVLSQ